MLHEPAVVTGKDLAFPYKRRIGVFLFIIYGLIYACFIALNVISPASMEIIVFSGLNLAVVYGFGLIILALLMALGYNILCGKREKLLAEQGASHG